MNNYYVVPTVKTYLVVHCGHFVLISFIKKFPSFVLFPVILEQYTYTHVRMYNACHFCFKICCPTIILLLLCGHPIPL